MNWDLRCNDASVPTGTNGTPWFSWQLEEEAPPARWRVQVLSQERRLLWDQETTCAAGSYLIYDGPPLASMRRYFWQVQARVGGQIVTSPAASFLTGILCEADWHHAQWIEAAPDVCSPLFRREIDLTEAQARDSLICICGLGLYELYCNGKKVSADRLTPARTDYAPVQYRNLQYPFSGQTRKSALYQTYDLRGLLRPGKNSICVWLGNGFYRQTVRTVEGEFDYGVPAFLCCIRCADRYFVSDGSWLTTAGPILDCNPFTGECFDARLIPDEQTVWLPAHCAPKKETVLRPQLCPPDGVWQHIRPTALANGVYDAGCNLTGVARITCRGKRGAVVRLTFAEQLKDGNPDYTSTCGYEEADRAQIQRDQYILRGDASEQYTPRFVSHGFRYVKIDAQDAELLDVAILRTGMLVEQAAFLETSMPEINALFQACTDTLRGNLSCGVLTDCPHRERLAYTGDGQLSADALMALFHTHAFYRKWIDDLLDAQDPETGYVPHTVPFSGGGGGPAWGSAIVIVPWLNYLHYGDACTLRSSLPAMTRWLDYLASHTDEQGLVCREEAGGWCLGDWVFPSDRPWSEPQPDQPLKPEFVNTCYYAKCLQIYHSACRALDIPPAYRYTLALTKTAAAVNQLFLRDGGYLGGVQGADAFALMAGIVPKAQERAVRDHLAAYYAARHCVPDTGMFGTIHVLEELSQSGRCDLAWKMLCRKDYPGILYLLTQRGYTTMGETWEGTGAQSHIAFTSVSAWLIRRLAGIRLNAPEDGASHIDIEPFFPDELQHLRAQVHVPAGTVRLEWQRSSDAIALTLSLPAGTAAELRLPGGVCSHIEKGSRIRTLKYKT